MKLPRRTFLRLSAGVAALTVLPRIALAQAYPNRPVRIIVGTAPGGAADIFARLIGDWLSKRFGQPVIVENRTGAGGVVAAEMVLRSPADGHTLFLAISSTSIINGSLRDGLNFVRDSAPVAMLVQEPIILSVNPALPAKTLPEFIAYAKANPGKLSMASPGNGTSPHIAGELFKIMAGIDMTHVPYRGGAPALTDLAGGQVQVAFMGPAASLGLVRSGSIRALAVTSQSRAAVLPDLPTVGEFVQGYEASNWFGLVAPKNTAPEIIDKLNTLINEGLADPQMRARLVDLGGTVVANSASDFGRRIAADADKWANVIRTAKISI
ncbi:MAG TPA: tripartite tricarboxylate transporter substrate binding protein [Xanthobacteraceae bacterium]|nr:tripartite tricarboxylate transporter substrate binding protein [Xanthobacteraceae bacterium]